MYIIFKNNKLEKAANNLAKAVRIFGSVGGKRYIQRIQEMVTVQNLKELMGVPKANCHQLSGNYKGKFALNLEYPYRLIIEPEDGLDQFIENGRIYLEKITSIIIIEVIDYHGK